ncbi:flagellar hook-associated protein FlgK [Pantoea allii]|uniref:Flagellar hook-associated protein 1 n=1 Tax=Pantoea allii TaxID=574096 RepID=A0ABS6VH04_9GAMM|nr:flagellar hook-associated protein FlgK [Pantoea allii]MBW1215029.1 flagellar hook-associated protein FlgK [Pantoea allii]MBW1258604.1 flagellar hook-associated protein FlgK [Pantoea allii]MBW1267825.1 flagellar hook-associated protein FlgK [Pantoea allii]MBW1289696.1 flagellar hook-associated protein FlgK [Pantoea allii]
MTKMINSAMSGLLAAQAALSNTSNNISNYTVPGYARRTLQLAEAHNTSNGNAYYGNGVNITGVQREYDAFVMSQLRNTSAAYNAASTQHAQISRIDDVLSRSTGGLSSSLQGFFANVQNVVSNANDPAARQSLLSNAQSLVNQFQVTARYLSGLQDNVNSDIASHVNQINTLSSQVAHLNEQISKLSTAAGAKPNDLLDQRDQMVNTLNNLIGVKVSQQDGKYNVSTASGFSLVTGNSTTQLIAMQSGSDLTRTTVGYVDKQAGKVQLPESLLRQGSLGGALNFRNEDLDLAQNKLGQLAATFTTRFNAVHREGFDSKGKPGGDFFTIGTPTVQGDTRNTSSATLTAAWNDTSALKASNYTVSYNGTNWTAIRAADNAKIDLTPVTSAGVTTLSVDGLTLTVNGTPNNRDSFLVKPLQNVVSSMSVAITNGSQIGAAKAKGGESDNRNAQKLLALQDARVVNGSSTLFQAYASMLSETGNKTKSLETSATTQKNVLTQLTNRQQAVSGVNLDEEYANLTRYQQYYMANAQVLKTAGSLFEALLSIR